MDKLWPTGQNLSRGFNFKSGSFHAAHLLRYKVKLPNLELKTLPKQLLGSLQLDIELYSKARSLPRQTFAPVRKYL